MDIGSKLDFNLGQILGNDARDKLRAMSLGSPAAELVKKIFQHFPILTSLFQVGAFYREFALPLLYMGLLQERLNDSASKLSQPERLRIEMAITALFMELPGPLSALLLGTSEKLVNMLPERAQQRAAVVAQVGRDLNAFQPLSEQMDIDSFAEIVREIHLFGHKSESQSNQRVPRLLEIAESHALALRPGENVVGLVYTQFCSEFAQPQWAMLIDAMEKHADSMEVPFDHKTFQRDLIGRAIVQPKGQTEDAIHLLRSPITTTYAKLDPAAFLHRADKQLAKVRDLEIQIATLGANLTVSAIAKIGALAEAGSAEIKANRGWFKDEIGGLLPVVRAWQGFYADWDRLHRKAPGVATKSRASLSVVEKLTGQRPAPTVVPPDLQHLQAELETAHATIEQNGTALAELRTEIFNLRSLKESGFASRRPESLAVSMDLVRRVAIRDAMTPTDVLVFIEATSEGRVVVLDSAWKSAKEAATFQGSVRMLEVISAMVFGYYDSIMSGNPDATARVLLGNTYSANESESTSSQRRLRALREFDYLGSTHYFERHLKVGNGSGLEVMRIHFDIIDGKVVIAYAGPHLEVWTSN